MSSSIQTAPAAPFDTRHFRHALSQFATGVTVITTTAADGSMLGITATSFNSVSLQPPLVLWSLGSQASSLASFTAASHYVINILSAEQAELANRFASKVVDRFSGIDITMSAHGHPVLRDCVGWFECSNRSRYPEGDHVIFVGEVTHCEFTARAPLLFHGGAFASTRSM